MSMQDKRLVVFGCGYVGSALAIAAREAGAQVTALTRNPERAASLRAAGIEVVEADLLTTTWQHRLPAGADFVVNCVSAGRAGDAITYRHTYVGSMRAIAEWMTTGPRSVGTLVYTSSTGVYSQSGGAEVDESAPTSGGDARSEALLAAECESHAASGAQRRLILRLAGIYGPGRQTLLDQLRKGAEVLPGFGEHHLNLIHRDDVVSAIMACIAARQELSGGVFNVADGAPERRSEVVRWLCRRLNRPLPQFDSTAGSSVSPRQPEDRRIVNRRLRDILGWRPKYPSYREGYGALLGEL